MSFGNSQPYDAYTEGGVLSSDPVRLIVLLYEGAIQSLDDAAACLKAGDFAGRARHVAKVIKIINELLLSLRDDQGADVSQNLRRLYTYMQSQLLRPEARKMLGVLEEVRALMSTLLDGWRTISEAKIESSPAEEREERSECFRPTEGGVYSDYSLEDDGCTLVASF